MKCPTCADVTLVMADRQGVEIDYCPQCRGVWLDRGELDKLIERSLAQQPQAQAQPAAQPLAAAPAAPRHGHRDFEDSDFRYREGGYRKRKSWLSDIFD